MRFFSRSNTVDLTATKVDEPWTLTPFVYPPQLSKTEIRALWKSPQFRHHFLTHFEGMTETVFVSKEARNRPVRMHCLVIDYDAKLSGGLVDHVKAHPGGDYAPAWMVTTVSGNARLVWDFEEPVGLANDQQAVAFLTQCAKRLHLSSWLPALDRKCLLDVYQCYELGQKWEPIEPGSKIPTEILHSWLLDASKGITLLGPEETKTEIPIECVAETVAEKYPGRWQGDFVLGARGIRFWDSVADNPTAAVVCPDGMMCFTGDKPFMSWKAIFGPKFVEEYEARKADLVMARSLWDDRSFWLKLDDGNWEKFASDSFSRWLKCQGFSAKPEAAGRASEIDQVMTVVQTNCRVRAVLPFIFRPHGITTFNDERLLNISRVKVLQPVDAGIFHDFDSAIKTFPWTWSFLTQMLELVNGRPVQLTYLLYWMKHIYESGYHQDPRPGHAIVIAGNKGKGKTFFATALLSKMLGGSGDSSDYLIRGSQWSNQLAKWPLALIDDSQGSANHEVHSQFSALVKKLVANRRMSYNGKYESTGEVEWMGRVVILCNDDSESLRLLPTMEDSIADKISLLRANPDSQFVFPKDENETRARLSEELPYFCRFLLDVVKYDESALDPQATRFFLRPYHHPMLLAHACRGGNAYNVYEVLEAFLRAYKTEKPTSNSWEGTATQLYQLIYGCNIGGATLGRLNPRSLGIALAQMQAKGMRVTATTVSTGVQCWHIPLDLQWNGNAFFKSGDAVASFLGNKTQPQETQNGRHAESSGTGDRSEQSPVSDPGAELAADPGHGNAGDPGKQLGG